MPTNAHPVDRRPLLKLGPAAAYLSIAPRTLRSLIATGEIRVIRVSPRRVAIAPEDLDAYVERKRR